MRFSYLWTIGAFPLPRICLLGVFMWRIIAVEPSSRLFLVRVCLHSLCPSDLRQDHLSGQNKCSTLDTTSFTRFPTMPCHVRHYRCRCSNSRSSSPHPIRNNKAGTSFSGQTRFGLHVSTKQRRVIGELHQNVVRWYTDITTRQIRF